MSFRLMTPEYMVNSWLAIDAENPWNRDIGGESDARRSIGPTGYLLSSSTSAGTGGSRSRGMEPRSTRIWKELRDQIYNVHKHQERLAPCDARDDTL